MSFNQDTIERLKLLREKKKFSDSDWEERGLYPSDRRQVDEMVRLTDICLDELLADIKANRTEKEIGKTLIKGLNRFKTNEYDTEEMEFIGDEFHNIGKILGLDISANLHAWSSGETLGTIIGLTKTNEAIVALRTFECTNCKLSLNLKVTATRDGVPDHWIIGQCDQCGEYNLLSTGENAGRLTFENFSSIEILNCKETSQDQASARLDQIKHFKGQN
jgi:hypothetical protein